jgi:hypothetical protein
VTLLGRIRNRLGRILERPAVLPNIGPSFAESATGGDQNYLGVCRLAAIDAGVFANFRRHPAYTTVLEHVSAEQGSEYLRLLSPNRRARKGIAEVVKNDAIGNPVTMQIESGTAISPTTLRYLKVADDIERLFGTLRGADVVEIGVGYGGQCRVLDALFELGSYTLIDLKPVLHLAEEFLSRFPLRCAVRFQTMNELAPRPYDLAVSNYAFSELSRGVQDVYFDKVLRGSSRGYVTYNNIVPDQFHAMTSEEIAGRLNGRILPELPLTHPRNCIIVWGSSE